MKTITIHNLKESTAQEVFDFIADHLLTQNEQALRGAMCSYRAEDGNRVLKCAAGVLIPYEEYRDTMEGKGYDTLIKTNPHWSKAHVELIVKLQHVHDGNLPEYWKRELQELAIRENLTLTNLAHHYTNIA